MDCSKATLAHNDRFMRRAVKLARKGRGQAAPNPCVGSVLVQGNEIVAEGWHAKFGGPHAERNCLANAADNGVNPTGGTLFVTLEPCNHQGKTPPCTEAIIKAGISRVVIGTMDPNPVAAGGAQKLREHGIEVVTDVLKQECLDLIADFQHWQNTDRAWCILKMAATLDGKIASRTGKPEAVSSPQSFKDVHRYRALADAVMVGGTTFTSDDPSLTCRLDKALKDNDQPYAVVVTSTLPIVTCDLKLIGKRPKKTVFLTTETEAKSKIAHALQEIGVRVWGLPRIKGDQGLELKKGLARLRQELGCHYVLCEGGGLLATSLMEQECTDEFVLYLAPRILGDDQAKPLFTGRSVASMSETLNLRVSRFESCGPDLKITLLPR